MFYFSPTLRIIVDCKLIQKSVQQKLYKIKPCGLCKHYFYTKETGPSCFGYSLVKKMVYDITRNIFVTPNCSFTWTKR